MSEFDNDLYGDLDLEDLDATQLDEELVDPDQEKQEDNKESSAPHDAPIKHEPAPAAAHDSHASGSGQHGGNDGYFENRMRPSDMPDEGKMFIGGLNWETTDDGLRSYFSQFGDIDNCTIMRDPTGRSRGFAFSTFKSVSSVEAVSAKDHQSDGKMIDPKRAIPRAEHERTAKVFVGGLAPSVTSDSSKQFLSQYGKVMDATVMFDRSNGRSKGFAFATFADESGVENAMQHSGVELEGRQIEIKKAQPRGAGTQVKTFNAPGGARTSGFNATSGMGMGGGFDPSAMAMMYQNMMKGNSMGMSGGMSGGFDPSAMAVMYQNMMKNMGMNQAPAINPNMAQRGNMGMGMGNNMMMNPMMMGMNPMMGMGGMMGGGMMNNGGGGGMGRGRGPNAPRGPSAMRGGGPSGMAQPMAQGSSHGGNGNGSGPQRYSTQGSQRAKPY